MENTGLLLEAEELIDLHADAREQRARVTRLRNELAAAEKNANDAEAMLKKARESFNRKMGG